MESLAVLVVEDQAVLREGLKQLIASEEGLSVAGEAGSVAEAIAPARPYPTLLGKVSPRSPQTCLVSMTSMC